MLRRQAWLAGCAVVLFAAGAEAIFLDEDQNITLQARIYSQAAIRLENSEIFTEPPTKTGQLIQQRNFFNPELDAKLKPYLGWMKGSWLDWMAPDDLNFRIAAWGFYDGIYDYGSGQFDRAQSRINASFNNQVPAEMGARAGGWYARGPNIKLCGRDATTCAAPTKFSDVFSDFELYEPRSIYGHQARVNELYLSYSKGPFFLRVGKQSISWGESDTIALLDQGNPFDLTLAAPGFFQDIDEARIPLYTVRTSYNLFDALGPFSSGFIEGYWVPGGIDATTAITPLLAASPYSPRGVDPQLLSTMPGGVFPPSFQFVFFDHIPKSDISSSRWGIRFQTLINRAVTMQAWVYRTFPNVVPVKVGFQTSTQQLNINGTNFFPIALEHNPSMVYGLAATFFSETVDGIFRLNAQLFEHEQGFVPQTNLNICPINPQNNRPCTPWKSGVPRNQFSRGHVPFQDILRYEIGFDRFFFARFLNPTNSFLISASIVGSYNASYDEDDPAKEFRFNGQLKPGPVCLQGNGQGDCQVLRQRGAFQDDYVNNVALDAQGQITTQTDYLHGRLTPRLTVIQFARGTFAMHPSVIYRWNDWLLFQADYQFITGAYQSLGFFRDRDQVSVRMTYQLN